MNKINICKGGADLFIVNTHEYNTDNVYISDPMFGLQLFNYI